MQIEVKLLDPRLSAPTYATAGSAAVDLRACSVQMPNGPALPLLAELPTDDKPYLRHYALRPGEKILVGSGLAIHLGSNIERYTEMDHVRQDCAGLILPRSGLGHKQGIRLGNSVGLVDGDFLGEVMLSVENAGSDEFIIEPLMRLCQFVVVPVFRPEYVVVAEFSAARRRLSNRRKPPFRRPLERRVMHR